VVRHAHGHSGTASADDVRDAGFPGQDQGQATRPKPLCQEPGGLCDALGYEREIISLGQEDGYGFVPWTDLGCVDSLHSIGLEDVSTNAIDGVRGKGDKPAFG
jgi:hypothetical protein